MGERAFQVTRALPDEGMWEPLASGGMPISVIVYDAKDSGDARVKGAAMLGAAPLECTVEEFETTGLSMAEAIEQAEMLDASAEGGKQMAQWLREG